MIPAFADPVDPVHTNVMDACSVLIIDDVPANIQVLAEALQSEYRLKIATSGSEGLAVAQKSLPDLILLDVMMPGMDGFEVCRQLKSDPLTQRIPVIFVTARDANEDEELGLNLGAVDYISKPFYLPIVRARVRNHLLLKRRADLLENLAHVDSLTGIANRRRFDESLLLELRRCQRNHLPLSVLLIDIDHFKQYNDHYGHGMGDTCLTRVAATMAKSLGRAGDLIARYGGEEFAVILPGGDIDNARSIAERLCQAIRDLRMPHIHGAGLDYLTISIGVSSCLPGVDTGTDALLEAADKQLYAAKAAGRNTIRG